MGLNKKISQQIKRLPKYTINQEASDSQNLAKSRAFGRDRAIQTAQENLETQAANDIAAAQDATDSTSGLLATISAINANTTAGKRGLAQDEAVIGRENVGDVYATNEAMINEKDKEFYQNKYAPWEAKLQALQQKKAGRQQLLSSTIGGLLSGAGSLFSGGVFSKKA